MMAARSWIDVVTKGLNSDIAPLVVALDPDRLLVEEAMQAAINALGYEVLELVDEIAFRAAYETKFRDHSDKPLLVIQSGNRREDVPFDLLTSATIIERSLTSLFPNLSAPVIRAIDKSDLPALFDAQEREAPSRMNDSETKKFILLHVYGLVPEVVRTPIEILRELLRLNSSSHAIPTTLVDWFVGRLKSATVLSDWPVADLLTDRERFLGFLQERWPAFLDRLAAIPASNGMVVPLPEIPFGHQDIRGYIETLFIEGSLAPVPFANVGAIAEHWVRIGISGGGETADRDRLGKLLDVVIADMPQEGSRHRCWLTLAQRWAEASILWHGMDALGQADLTLRYQTLEADIDRTFLTWLRRHYSSLHSQPPVPPVMLHHVPRAMARALEDGNAKRVALVVVDGMAFDQWLILRRTLSANLINVAIHEDAVFAWIPTITSVSRQAVFSGRPPTQFGKHIGNTSKEASLWAQFWSDHGYTGKQVFYRKGLGDAGDLTEVEEAITRPQVKVIGLVVDKVDRIVHGMELGTRGAHGQVSLWASAGYLCHLVGMLVGDGFEVYLTSDHGNVEAIGIGRPAEGSNAEERGERVRIYSTQVQRQEVKQTFPSGIDWPAIGLPVDYLPLLAAGRDAFIAVGKKVVCHGGASLEEVVVPLVKIERV